MIDGSGLVGRGIAYSTREEMHLLNVPAERMSAWAGDPDHFVRRVEEQGVDRRGFAQRRLFGKYLGEILDEAVSSGRTKIVEAMAVGGARNGNVWRLDLDDGSSIEAEAAVLAIGNQEPERLSQFSDTGSRFICNPWGREARAAVEDLAANGGDALAVGTGLTMVDLVLSLESAGHNGRIFALSRRGLIPRAHAAFEAAPVDQQALPKGSVRALARWLRRRSADVGWRAAVDSLRPHSHALWQSLDLEQQRRFLRHARPWWDVHRHRIAPEVAATVHRLVGEGRLEIIAGRILAARATSNGIEVQYRRRGTGNRREMSVAYVFNCTGPLHAIQRTRNPLLRSLLDAGEIQPEPLGIGLEVNGNSRAGERLWALGPLTKGRSWEIIAVPDIREQAAEVADDIERELGA